jgi:hypothetical protein
MCAAKNRRFCESALRHGWCYGAQLPAAVYAPLHFADQDWKKPNLSRYLAAVAAHRPAIATVLDLERDEQFSEVLAWGEAVAPYVERIVIIPKLVGSISRLPRQVGGREVVLGYSVPTSYGGTTVPLWEFDGWPIHLLGGSPHSQMAYWCVFTRTVPPAWFNRRLQRFVARWWMFAGQSEVVSADGNMPSKMANGSGRNPAGVSFWRRQPGRKGHWVNLKEIGRGEEWDAPYTAFDLSMQHIKAAWDEVVGIS